jgi:hypothetical protein
MRDHEGSTPSVHGYKILLKFIDNFRNWTELSLHRLAEFYTKTLQILELKILKTQSLQLMNVIKRFHTHLNNETEKKFWVFLHCLNDPLK